MVEETKSVHWQPFNGRGEQLSETLNLPSPPPWRNFDRPILDRDSDRWSELLKLVEKEKKDRERGEKFRLSEIADNKTNSQNAQLQEAIDLVIAGVNAALCLRRPLLVTGRPGSGKTSLAYALAYQLKLGPVLKWSRRQTRYWLLYHFRSFGYGISSFSFAQSVANRRDRQK